MLSFFFFFVSFLFKWSVTLQVHHRFLTASIDTRKVENLLLSGCLYIDGWKGTPQPLLLRILWAGV